MSPGYPDTIGSFNGSIYIEAQDRFNIGGVTVPQNTYSTIDGDTGTTTAPAPNSTLNIIGGTGVTTVVTPNTVVINGSVAPVGANPTAEVDGTVVNGVATTFIRSDAAPPLADPFTPADGIQNFTGQVRADETLNIAIRGVSQNNYGVEGFGVITGSGVHGISNQGDGVVGESLTGTGNGVAGNSAGSSGIGVAGSSSSVGNTGWAGNFVNSGTPGRGVRAMGLVLDNSIDHSTSPSALDDKSILLMGSFQYGSSGFRSTVSQAALAGDISITNPNVGGTYVTNTTSPELAIDPDEGTLTFDGSGYATNSFSTWAVPAGTSLVADSPSDTATFATGSANRIPITGNGTTDTITFDFADPNIPADGIQNFTGGLAASTTLASDGNATLGDSGAVDAHTFNGATTINTTNRTRALDIAATVNSNNVSTEGQRIIHSPSGNTTTGTSTRDILALSSSPSGSISSGATNTTRGIDMIVNDVATTNDTGTDPVKSTNGIVMSVSGSGTSTGASTRSVTGISLSVSGTTDGTTDATGISISTGGGDTNTALLVTSGDVNFQTNTTLGDASSDTLTINSTTTANAPVTISQSVASTVSLNVTASAFPVEYVTRNTAATTGAVGVTRVRGLSSGNIADTFAPVIVFNQGDGASPSNDVLNIGAARDGADNSASFIVEPYNAGVATRRLTIDSTGDTTFGAQTTTFTPAAAQSITAVGNAITATGGTILQITANASYTLTSAPTIANGSDGQIITIMNVDTTDVVTIQDQGTLANSNLRLSTTTFAIGPRDSITLTYNSTVGDWVEIARTNVL